MWGESRILRAQTQYGLRMIARKARVRMTSPCNNPVLGRGCETSTAWNHNIASPLPET